MSILLGSHNSKRYQLSRPAVAATSVRDSLVCQRLQLDLQGLAIRKEIELFEADSGSLEKFVCIFASLHEVATDVES